MLPIALQEHSWRDPPDSCLVPICDPRQLPSSNISNLNVSSVAEDMPLYGVFHSCAAS